MILKHRLLFLGFLLFALVSITTFIYLPVSHNWQVMLHFTLNLLFALALLLTAWNLYHTRQEISAHNEALIRSENRQRTQAQFYNSLLNRTPVITFKIASDGTIKESIGKGLQSMGLGDNETVGVNVFEGWPDYAWQMQRALGGEPVQYEATGQGPNGPWWLLVWMFPDPAEPGDIMGFALDITYTRQTEQENTRHGQLMQGLLQQMPVIVFRFDPQGIFTESVGHGLKRLKLKEDEVVGGNVFELYKPYRDFFYRSLAGETVAFEASGITDEDPWWFQVTLIPERPPEDGAMGIAMDITDLKLAEEGLRQSEEKLRSIMVNAPDLIVSIGTDMKFRYVNHVLPGYTMEEVLGKSVLDFTEEGCRATAAEAIKLAIDKQQQTEYEVLVYGAEKKLTWYQTRVGPIIRNGQVEELTLISKDISGVKRRQELLRLSLKEKETLLKEVQHRVKNNLQIIISLLNLQTGRVQDTQLKTSLEDTKNRVSSIAMVHNMLYETSNVSQINMKNYIQTLSQRILHSYNADPEKIKIILHIKELILEVDKAIPCGLMINEFVSNSLKHAFPERQGQIEITMEETADYLIIKYSDNGQGAREGLLDKPSLGIKLVQTLTQQLSARIQVASDKGVHWECHIPLKERIVRNVP